MISQDDDFERMDLERQRARFRRVEIDPRERHDRGHVLAVMTCSGREPLFRRTLQSLELGGYSRWPGPSLVVGDGHVQRPGGSWWLFHTSARLDHRVGQARTFFETLRLATQFSGFSRLTMFEDDVVVPENALDYISSLYYPDDVAMFSWFHQLAPNPSQSRPVWMIGAARDHSCNQGITLSAKTVHELLASQQLKTWREPHGADMLIGQVMPDALVAHHFPNIVDHVGGDSSLVGNTGDRRSPTFVGESFDALDLTATP